MKIPDLFVKLFFVIIILFLALGFAATDNSNPLAEQFGGILSPLFGFFELFGASDQIHCPYVSSYTNQLYSSGELTITGNNPLCDAVEYAFCISQGGNTDNFNTSRPKGECTTELDIITEQQNDRILAFDGECALETMPGNDHRTTQIEIKIENENFDITIINQDGSVASSGTVSQDAFLVSIAEYEGLANQGLASALLGQLMPVWQCFIFFGLLPFIVMFMFVRDILGFTLLSPGTRGIISFFASLLAVQTGAFANIIVQIVKMAELSISTAFISVLLFFSMLSVVMSWMGSASTAAGEAQIQAAEYVAGAAQKKSWAAISTALKGGEKGDDLPPPGKE
ncbi:MAG: hypothetical protein GOU99_03380 [Candidatus Altiarchaeota archaeon]|nr:hypothetical protein [Candidatus Altiarchaeota archaeon]